MAQFIYIVQRSYESVVLVSPGRHLWRPGNVQTSLSASDCWRPMDIADHCGILKTVELPRPIVYTLIAGTTSPANSSRGWRDSERVEWMSKVYKMLHFIFLPFFFFTSPLVARLSSDLRDRISRIRSKNTCTPHRVNHDKQHRSPPPPQDLGKKCLIFFYSRFYLVFILDTCTWYLYLISLLKLFLNKIRLLSLYM